MQCRSGAAARWLYFARFLSVHNGGPSSNQAGLYRIQVILKNQEAAGRTLRDTSFRAFDTYPVQYQTHATILRALFTYSARAVFVDFAFIDDRPDKTIDD